MIRKQGSGWVVLDSTGTKRLGGPYKAKSAAIKRLKQVDWFKSHKKRK